MRTRIFTILIILSLVLAACSKPSAPVETATAEATEVVILDIPTEETDDYVIKSIDEAKNATIQIEAQGSFVDPEFGQLLNTAGRGSGFIIHPSGIAITNNHVVEAAVERGKPRKPRS